MNSSRTNYIYLQNVGLQIAYASQQPQSVYKLLGWEKLYQSLASFSLEKHWEFSKETIMLEYTLRIFPAFW